MADEKESNSTPMGKKTRAAMRLNNVPKTPTTSEKCMPETPRRSARKSVRPAMDYDEIIVNNIVRSSIKDMQDATAANSNTAKVQSPQKWTTGEVGRVSRKRNRKTKQKRKNNSKANKENRDRGRDISEVKELLPNTDNVEIDKEMDMNKVVMDSNVENDNSDDEDMPSLIMLDDDDILFPKPNEVIPTKQENIEGASAIKSGDDIMEVESKDDELEIRDDERTSPSTPSLLELFKLNSDQQENIEEPSAMTSDDVIMEVAPKHDELQMRDDESASAPTCNNDEIKIVISDVDNQNITLQSPNIKHLKPSKGYRFPTPLKPKREFNFFNNSVTLAHLSQMPHKTRRRSKSFCELNSKKKTVSFLSPAEVTLTHDIDKRWKILNDTSNLYVNLRRKRSMSVDDVRMHPSRIPKPKPMRIITPSKVQASKKMPNFAAIHQKQFAKMENIVEHIERKAERAKALTNSALKLKQLNGSTQKSSSKGESQSNGAALTTRTRGRAIQKINFINADAEKELLKKLPISQPKVLPVPQVKTPLKNAHANSKLPVVVPKPPFNLYTIAANSHSKDLNTERKGTEDVTNKLQIIRPPFNLYTNAANSQPTALATERKVADDMKNKLQARQQRHMDMFKGRPGGSQKHAGQENRGDFIRGVRLNRRFELQMQQRRNLDGI